MDNELILINNYPIIFNNTHESIYRSHHLLKLIMGMVKRRDSHDTILMVYDAAIYINEISEQLDNLKKQNKE